MPKIPAEDRPVRPSKKTAVAVARMQESEGIYAGTRSRTVDRVVHQIDSEDDGEDADEVEEDADEVEEQEEDDAIETEDTEDIAPHPVKKPSTKLKIKHSHPVPDVSSTRPTIEKDDNVIPDSQPTVPAKNRRQRKRRSTSPPLNDETLGKIEYQISVKVSYEATTIHENLLFATIAGHEYLDLEKLYYDMVRLGKNHAQTLSLSFVVRNVSATVIWDRQTRNQKSSIKLNSTYGIIEDI